MFFGMSRIKFYNIDSPFPCHGTQNGYDDQGWYLNFAVTAAGDCRLQSGSPVPEASTLPVRTVPRYRENRPVVQEHPPALSTVVRPERGESITKIYPGRTMFGARAEISSRVGPACRRATRNRRKTIR